ncbi:hypothetical protein P8452_11074 [Trifolium repens]|nr:hypothetical protein P8452_11074 [Trifolium repens]
MASSTSSSTTTNKVTLKLLIDTKNEKVLFAEASKAVIDFLFNLLRLPVDDDDDDEEEEEEDKKKEDDDDEDEEKILIKNGFVKDSVTYMVMDDLVIHPLFSAISMIDLLNSKFNIKDITALQEKVVEFGVNEGIKLIEACMQSNSKMILTSVFLNKED